MGLDLAGAGAVATAAQKIIGMFFPDKTVEEQGKLSAALAMLSAQTDIDKTEAASSDPLQHWRGGLGWVCVIAYLYNFVLEPIMEAGAVVVTGHALPFPILSIEPLAALTLGMLGLGGLHVAERVKGAT